VSEKFPTAKLIDIAELNPTLRKKLPAEELVSFVPMASLSAESASVETTQDRPYAEVAKGFTPFLDGDVLVAKITPCFENGKIAQARLPRSYGFGSTEFHVVRARSGIAESRYLHHYLRLEEVRANGQRRMTGSGGQRRVPASFLSDLAVPVPPLVEQSRIAAILDQAETLRTQRRTALALLDSLTQSLFLDMFGDPVVNPKGWDAMQFGNGIATSLRNGLSPSTDGKVMAKVLTLSAITGESFNPDAWKLAPFHAEPPAQQAVDENDFLVCRGNGNVKLVGKGYFPSKSFTDVTFPDTIIAARINGQSIKREYLQFIWNSKAVRLQIEALARTTNGTFKVNQMMLERIQILVPPLPLQQTFATRIASIEALKATHRRTLAALDALFASLQQRAFAGQL